MSRYPSKLTKNNIVGVLENYDKCLSEIGARIHETDGLEFLTSIKRRALKLGRYPKVSLFEAANRIMSDLVVLHGVKWLLHSGSLPFKSYNILYGNDNKGQDHDVHAHFREKTLRAEAFNVAPSYYYPKRGQELEKLRRKSGYADYRLIMVNHDALRNPNHQPKNLNPGEHLLIVNIKESNAWFAPELER